MGPNKVCSFERGLTSKECLYKVFYSTNHGYIRTLLSFVAPLGPPATLSTSGVQATAFTLSWSLPTSNQRAGWVITGFRLNCTNSDGYPTWRASVNGNSSLTLQRSGVEEYTTYRCCVAAASNLVVGDGRCVSVTTAQAGKCAAYNLSL